MGAITKLREGYSRKKFQLSLSVPTIQPDECSL
jgi:hypothetical protein